MSIVISMGFRPCSTAQRGRLAGGAPCTHRVLELMTACIARCEIAASMVRYTTGHEKLEGSSAGRTSQTSQRTLLIGVGTETMSVPTPTDWVHALYRQRDIVEIGPLVASEKTARSLEGSKHISDVSRRDRLSAVDVPRDIIERLEDTMMVLMSRWDSARPPPQAPKAYFAPKPQETARRSPSLPKEMLQMRRATRPPKVPGWLVGGLVRW